jgi:hypothetical protein
VQTTVDEDGLRHVLTVPVPIPVPEPPGEAVAATAAMQGAGRE